MTSPPTDSATAPEAKPVPWWHFHRRLYDWVLHWAHTRYGTPALAGLAFAESSFFPIPPDVLLMALGIARPRRAFYYAAVCSVASVVGGMLGYVIGLALWNPVGAPILKSFGLLNAEHQQVLVRSAEGSMLTIGTPQGVTLHASRWSQWLGLARPSEADEGSTAAVHRGLLHRDPPAGVPPVGNWQYEVDQTTAPLASGDTAYLMTDTYHQARALYEKYDFWIVFAAAFTPIPYKVFTILSGLMQMQFLPFLLASLIGRSMRFFLVGGLIFAFGEPVKRFIDRYFNLIALLFFVLLIGFFAILGI
ncbi:MAG TPA: VTT domain-containing protein [Planctomycetota bacterium]|nr:VTT domain-containing protein [Planctomycetota bacterium]